MSAKEKEEVNKMKNGDASRFEVRTTIRTDVDENALDFGLRKNDLEGFLDGLSGSSSSNVEEV